MNTILLVTGAVFVILWGTAHMFPTKSVVREFGSISEDNKKIITMEWINEGLTLIFIGIIVLISTFWGKENINLSRSINVTTSIMLFAMASLSLLTAFKIKNLAYKLCPFIFITSAILILVGTFI